MLRTDRDAVAFAAADAPLLAMMRRILFSYIMFDQDLGYSQGMSDILAPVLLVMPHEAEVCNSMHNLYKSRCSC